MTKFLAVSELDAHLILNALGWTIDQTVCDHEEVVISLEQRIGVLYPNASSCCEPEGGEE